MPNVGSPRLPHGLRGTWCPGSAPIAKLLGLYDLSLRRSNLVKERLPRPGRRLVRLRGWAHRPSPVRKCTRCGTLLTLTKTAEIPDWGYSPVAGGTILASPSVSGGNWPFWHRPPTWELQCVLICTKSRTAHRNALTAASPFASFMAASSVGAAQPEHFSATSSVPMTPRKPHSNRGQEHVERACRYGTQRCASAPERRAS
jgi:hypothetical protein